jgi:serine/alanine adding enzyme
VGVRSEALSGARDGGDGEGLELGVHGADHSVPGWDEFVEGARGGTYCHLSGWRQIMTEVLGHDSTWLHARDGGGRLVGVLPLVSVHSRLFGRFLVSMPFLNYGGPLGTGPARRRLAREAVQRAEAAGADLLELRWRSAAALDGPDERLTFTDRKVNVVLPLPDDPEVLWKDVLRSKVRSQVRRPMKEGLDARFGTDQIRPFYDVFCHNMRDLGTPVLPRRLFEALPDAFGDRVRFCVVYRQGEPVAGGCGFHCAGEFEITWASALRAHSRVAPNMLLYWRLMEHAVEAGAERFSFGRCTPDTGSHRFKSQWGGEDEPLPWAAWSPDSRLATPNPDDGRYGRAIAVWQRLPVGLTRWLGPPLARRLP